MSGINNPVRANDVDELGMLPVNPGARMLGINQLMGDTVCWECGHALVEHDGDGECWHIYPGGDTPCSCWWFVPHVRYNPVALEYIGAAFLVWSAARRETQELLWERDERE